MARALEMLNIFKTFPGVKALVDVTFDLEEGEVHALVGENGAGKSTLMKILFGVYSKDAGRIKIKDKEVELHGSADSYHQGIRLIPQELSLIPTLSVMENVFAGHIPTAGMGFVDWKQMRARTVEALGQLGLSGIDPRERVFYLSMSEQQMVAITRAFQASPAVIVFDEPTSSLSREETHNLFTIIRRLKSRGLGIVYITHRLEEVPEIADRVTVMRDGKVSGACGKCTVPWLIEKMAGMSEEERFPRVHHEIRDDVALEVRDIQMGQRLRGVSFKLRRGEILGITGFVGAGKTELAKVIFGVEAPDSGEIFINGKKVDLHKPKDAMKCGIALVPEDRRSEGLVTQRMVRENMTLPSIDSITLPSGLLNFRKERQLAEEYVKSLNIATPSTNQRVKYLSGGNQQKVVVAKWSNAKAEVFIFDEATRGIDVGAKAEIFKIMGELAHSGASIVMISMEFPEILGISDRIIVMHEGRITAELSRSQATLESLYAAAAGGKDFDEKL